MATASETQKCAMKNNSRLLDDLEVVIHEINEELDGFATFGNLQVFCSKEVITEDVMRKAVQLATVRNPLLGSKIVTNDKGAYMFTPIEPEEIDFKVYNGRDWEMILNTETYKRFHENSSLIKTVFLPNIEWKYSTDNSGFEEHQYVCGLYIAFDHEVSDDNRAARFTDNILTYLDEIITKKEFSLNQMKMLPGVSHYLKDKLRLNLRDNVTAMLCSFGFLRKFLMGGFPKCNAYIKSSGSELQRNPDMERSSCYIPIEIAPGELAMVVRKCNEHGTTVNGAVQAAYLQAFATVMSAGQFGAPLTICHMDALDFRRWYFPDNHDVPADYSMNAAYGMTSSTSVSPVKSVEQFWEMARNMKKQTHEAIRSEQALYCFKMYPILGKKLIRDIFVCSQEDPTQRIEACLHTSNLGRCDFLNRGNASSVKMRSKYGFLTCKDRFGVIFQNNIYTFEGRLFWSVTYEKHVVKPEHAEQYVRLVRNWFVKQSPE